MADAGVVLREAGEDYLEVILRLEKSAGPVRSVDVANELCVSRPSVNKAVAALKKAGMVEQQPYGRISLTDRGRERAESVRYRHEMIKRFLSRVLGVGEETAEIDACRMEHVISDETMARLDGYVKRMEAVQSG